MSYIKHEFASGDTLYASDLNEMDEQIFKNTEALQNLPNGGYDLDVQINGKSIVENGVATIPLASKDAFGVAKIYPAADKNAPGVGMSGNNILTIVQATTGNIDGRVSQKAITSNNIDYAVKCAMTDGKGAEWTAEEKASARERIGVSNYPKKVFEYEWKDNYDKINVTAIDFENGILTVDAMPTQITDNVSTTVRVFAAPLIDGVETRFLYGNIPQEFYNHEYLYGVKIGENQLRIYDKNSTIISTLTDSGNIDLTRLQLYVEKSRNRSVPNMRIESIEHSHRYKILFHIPKGAHTTAGITFYKSTTHDSGMSYGMGYGEGYTSNGVDFYDGQSMYVYSVNDYESVSTRMIRYSLNTQLYTKLPRVFTADVYPINDKVSKADVTVGYFYPADKTPTASSKIVYHDLKNALYLQTPFIAISFAHGNANYLLDGARCEVWDYGEVF